MFYPCTAIVASLVRSAAPMVLFLAFVCFAHVQAQPVLSEAPPAGKDRIETVIRLKKGRTVRGRVLDHLGKPVKDASRIRRQIQSA